MSGVFSTNLLSVLIHFLLADCLGDILLTALPIIFLLDMKLSRERMISIFATFSASMVINVLTVTQATVPLKPDTSGSVVIAHTKASVRSGAHKPRVSYEMHAASNSLLALLTLQTALSLITSHVICSSWSPSCIARCTATRASRRWARRGNERTRLRESITTRKLAPTLVHLVVRVPRGFLASSSHFPSKSVDSVLGLSKCGCLGRL